MQLNTLDWIIVGVFFATTLGIGLLSARRSGRDTAQFFLSGRSMPWWLLGMSMVATTFATDTPNLVTDIVRQNGVAGNWVWWAFLLTGMLTVFVYARLWRRSGVATDLEFYELRYSGKAAAFLRGFRALYLGVFFNVCIMATVTLAAIKIGSVMLGFTPLQTLLVASLVTVFFSAVGGFRAVVLTDFVLFFLSMTGAIAAAVVLLGHPDVGGLNNLLANAQLEGKLSMLPAMTKPDGSSNFDLVITVLIIPLAVQWWSVWYPGSEPGGGGYVAQRMLSARNEQHAVAATLFFNAAHYAVRPWPWILVALCSLVVFPLDLPSERAAAEETLKSEAYKPLLEQYAANPAELPPEVRAEIETLQIQAKGLTSIRAALPQTDHAQLGHDLAYPAMLTFLPHGLLGLLVASLIAAYMSTISTQLNWGSSYVVNDFWKRFVEPSASERKLVWVGRLSTVLIMVAASGLALWLETALQAFQILLRIGAGTGLLFIMRWFWWRINPYSELTAMVVSFLVAVAMESPAAAAFSDGVKLLLGVGITTVAWVLVTLITPSSDTQTLRSFYRLTRPGGMGWKKVIDDAAADGEDLHADTVQAANLPLGILCMLVGCLAIYATLFATGFWIYGQTPAAINLTLVALVSAVVLAALWKKVTASSSPPVDKQQTA